MMENVMVAVGSAAGYIWAVMFLMGFLSMLLSVSWIFKLFMRVGRGVRLTIRQRILRRAHATIILWRRS